MSVAKYLPLLAVLVLAGCGVIDLGRVEAKREVMHLLIDPDSAQFTGVFQNEKTGAYCGWVNAKNRFGGYEGSEPFAVKKEGNPRVHLYAPTVTTAMHANDAGQAIEEYETIMELCFSD